MIELAKMLVTNRTLECLDITEHFIGGNVMIELAKRHSDKSIRLCRTLINVGNRLVMKESALCFRHWKIPETPLYCWILGDYQTIGIKGIQAIAKCLGAARNQYKVGGGSKALHLQNCEIEDDGTFLVADALKTNNQLEILNLMWISI